MQAHIKQAFQDAQEVLTVFNQDSRYLDLVQKTAAKISAAFKNGRKVLICGNGGSACDAMHFAEEFTGRYRKDRKALPVIALNDPAHITCVGNDFGFEHIFSRGVEAFGKPGDVFIGISTSGNSQNVIFAQELASQLGMSTVALLGKDGGLLKSKSQIEFIVPGKTTDRIQELHMLILHIIIEAVERELFPELYV
jgi:D-sedoheptulose 7-phosphate isomerase